MAETKISPISDASTASRLREIDALFSSGGLTRSPHKKAAAASRAGRASSKNVASSGKRASGAKKIANSGKKRSPRATRKQEAQALEILHVPEWEQHRWLVHGFSTRMGGVSTVYRSGVGGSKRKQPCGELNLGFTTTDTRENVIRNRELFVQALLDDARSGNGGASRKKAKKMPLHLLRQIHSGLMHCAEARGNASLDNADTLLQGDGWIATEPGALLGIQTADCIPILVADVRQRIVAAFHAGWRGTLARIVERGVGRLRAEFGSRPGDLTAAIGPGIGRCCYSVGEEVRMEFSSQFGYADELFQEVFDLDPIKEKYPMLFLTARAPGHSNLGPSLHLDLIEANRRQLLNAGLASEKIYSLNLCTACDTRRFFSHRAEHGFTGRMVSAIGIQSSFA